MANGAVRARRPDGPMRAAPFIVRDADVLSAHLEDAAHFPGGFASGIAAPTSEAEVAELLRTAEAVLPIGAQSSLTGGATPRGELLLSTSRLNQVVALGDDWVRAEAGVTLVDLDAVLARHGKYYPPVPTFTGAFVGGIVATNAAGAATFKYGTTREWVRAITVVLAGGDVLEIERGAMHARGGRFELTRSDRVATIAVPTYRLPQVAKVSAGYFAAPDMDLIDLFIGSEGTLGVITTVTFRALTPIPTTALALVPVASEPHALALVADLRRERAIAAIEHMDR